jgi:glutathione synthase/RimK-type ligase-like ATP-grasp enzyme
VNDTLIIAYPSDLHAVAVAHALRRKAHPATYWHSGDFPSRETESIAVSRGATRVRARGPGLLLEDADFQSVWHRRPRIEPDRDLLHPADRNFARVQCEVLRRGFLHLLAPDAFWVNPPSAAYRVNNKILQQQAARSCGLAVPETLYSNDPREIRDFIAGSGGSAIYKPFTTAPWNDGTATWACYASVVTAGRLVDDDILRQTPGIYQEVVPKDHELRVTIMGREAFCAKILSQETVDGRVDWRRAYDELTMVAEPLSAPVLESCLELMRRLSIVFGCFDFIVTPEGEHVFLEVNEMGQFLFIEEYTGLPLLDAFADFLIAGDPDFRYRKERPAVRFGELHEEIARTMEENERAHVPASRDEFDERPESARSLSSLPAPLSR